MNKITSILLLLAVLLSAVMAVQTEAEEVRPGGFYLRGEEEQDLIREVS